MLNFYRICFITLSLFASYVQAIETPNISQQGEFKESQAAASRYQLADAPAWVTSMTMPATKTFTEPVVVRLADTQFHWVGDAHVVYVHRAIQANETSGVDDIGQISMEFNPEYQTLQLHSVRVIRDGVATDRRASFKVRFLERELGLESSIYTGTVTAVGLVDDVRVGDMLEYAYSVIGSNPVFAGKLADMASWENVLPTELRHVSVQVAGNRRLNYRFVGATNIAVNVKPKEVTLDGVKTLTFDQSNIPAVRPEVATPVGYEPFTWLQFSEFDNWQEVAIWASGLFQIAMPSGGEFNQIVARLKALSTPQEQVVEALKFVQSEIRYTSVSLGENSHRPTSPDEVIKRRYGDCKDKSLLLVSLLRAVGISADPVLLSLSQPRGISKLLPSPILFDHVISKVTVDGKTYWLDGTAQQRPVKLETLGRLHAYAEVMPVNIETKKLTQIQPLENDLQYTSSLRHVLRLPAFDKEAELESTSTMYGLSAEYFRSAFKQMSMQQIKKDLLEGVRRNYANAEWQADPEVKDDPVANKLQLITRFKIKNYAEKRDEAWVIRHAPSNISQYLAMPPTSKRSAPLGLSYPIHATYEYEVVLPENVLTLSNDQNKSVTNAFFSLKQTTRRKGNILRAEYDFSTLANVIPAKDLDTYIAAIRKVNNDIHTLFVIGQDEMRTAKSEAKTPEAALEASLREQLQRGVDNVTRVIDAGKLNGRDLAIAYAERASSQSEMGRITEAKQDIAKALALDPLNFESHRTQGELHFNTGELDKALADYNKALSGAKDTDDVFYRRGIIHMIEGRQDQALEELQKAIKATNDDERIQFYQIWYAIAALRAGKTIPADMQQSMNNNLDGAWPRPIAGLYTGKRSVDEIIAIANKAKDEDHLLKLCEAYFYIAEYYLAKGDQAQAKAYFTQSKDTRAIVYLEYWSSGLELAKLEKK